jgi:hypothetical protein
LAESGGVVLRLGFLAAIGLALGALASTHRGICSANSDLWNHLIRSLAASELRQGQLPAVP